MENSFVFNSLSWYEVLSGYMEGIFPMGVGDKYISWYETSPRAVIPMDNPLKISRSLKQIIKKNTFDIRFDTAFEEVIRGCAEREDTWINELIIKAYTELFYRGYAHSVEAWSDGVLCGGLYGVAYRGAFFGESMFFRKSNASKVCVVSLYELLRKNGFRLLDIQMMTPHFKKFGAVNITRERYRKLLNAALKKDCKFNFT